MLNRNGANLVTRALQPDSPSTRRFFSLFYRLNRIPSLINGNRAGTRRRQKEPRIQRRDLHNAEELPDSKIRRVVDDPISEKMRILMRSLTAPVVVLTTSLPYRKALKRGMTLSSFTTLSMEPEPIITFNIKSTEAEPSQTFTALKMNRHFLIHLLEAGKEGARIAEEFTKGNGGREGFRAGLDLKGLKWQVSDGKGTSNVLPWLGGEGVKQVLKCEILDDGVEVQGLHGNGEGIVRVGDHMLIVARVNAILGYGEDVEGYGLSYADGKYRRVGKEIGPGHGKRIIKEVKIDPQEHES